MSEDVSLGESSTGRESAVTRRLLLWTVADHRRERAFERDERGEIPLETLATQSDRPLHVVLTELREHGVSFQYSTESLYEDVPDA